LNRKAIQCPLSVVSSDVRPTRPAGYVEAAGAEGGL